MQRAIQSAPVSKKAVWAGRVMSALVLFLVFDGVLKFIKPLRQRSRRHSFTWDAPFVTPSRSEPFC